MSRGSPWRLLSSRRPASQVYITSSSPFQTLAGSCGKFAPFEIKEHMVLAPRFRTAFDQDLCDQLDQLLQQQNGEFSFLKDLKGRQPLRSGPTMVSNRNTNIYNRLVARETCLLPVGDVRAQLESPGGPRAELWVLVRCWLIVALGQLSPSWAKSLNFIAEVSCAAALLKAAAAGGQTAWPGFPVFWGRDPIFVQASLGGHFAVLVDLIVL